MANAVGYESVDIFIAVADLSAKRAAALPAAWDLSRQSARI